MLEAKILRLEKPDEKITFFNNFHIIKKPDLTLRPLLDCRTLNLHCQHEGMEYFSHLKMLTLLPKTAKYLSSFDLASGYLNLKIRKEDQIHFCFKDPLQRVLTYCRIRF